MMWQLSQPICMSSFARIARASNEEAAAFTARVVRHVLAIVAPVAIVAFVVGPYLIPLVYGSAFAETGEALRWLLPGIVAYSIEMPLGDYLMVRLARPGLIVAVQSGSIVLCAGLAVALIPHWGINAAAFATSVTYIGVIAVKSSVFSRATGIPTADLFLVNRQDLRALIKLAGRMLQTAGARTRVGRAA
jgi:O-antigen/teichoic acid export membrane protein